MKIGWPRAWEAVRYGTHAMQNLPWPWGGGTTAFIYVLKHRGQRVPTLNDPPRGGWWSAGASASPLP